MFQVSIVLILGALSISVSGSVLPPSFESDGFGGRVVGGTLIPISAAPYQASIQYLFSHFCGGSVVSDYHIVTAAHCVIDDVPQDLTVRVGSNLHLLFGSVHNVASINTHPQYNASTSDYDVAVLKLTTPITNSAVKTVDLAIEETAAGQALFVSGWGVLLPGLIVGPFFLHGATVNAVARATCNMPSSYNGAITERMMCAAAPGKDSCQGDSGGPLVLQGNEETPSLLVGIVSWGNGCAQNGFPGVYTDVTNTEIRSYIISKMV